MQLWYNTPAAEWSEALPLGNGRLGAMVFGGVAHERWQLNEESVWAGGFIDRNNPDSLPNLPEVRALLRAGRIREAERLALPALGATPNTQRPYQPLGNLHLNFENPIAVDGISTAKGLEDAVLPGSYRRVLSLADAVATVEYRTPKGGFTRRGIASNPDDILALRLEASGGETLRFSAYLERGRFMDRSGKADEATVFVDGNTGENGIRFVTLLRAADCDGTVRVLGDHLLVENATALTLYVSAATSFRHEDPRAAATATLEKATGKGFEAILHDHIADHRGLFGRFAVELGGNAGAGSEADARPTGERIAALASAGEAATADPALIALHAQYGRYLLIASSRPGCLPANLMGLWNDMFTPDWDSKYTININTEMNYWPAGPTGLAECHLPLFQHLRRMLPNGRHTAGAMYGCRGFTAHHNTDLYGDTAPQDLVVSATFWPMGAAWLCNHITMHYAFTGDVDFLRENFDLLHEAVLFFADFLIDGPDGTLVTSPSISPENTYILPNGESGCLCEGPTMDNQILAELFTGYINAANTLGVQDPLVQTAEEMRRRLPKEKLGSRGQLLEWMEEYDEPEPGHRHISHLYGLFPGDSLFDEARPELLAAARKTLEERLTHGGGHTGWSRAWIISLWARLGDGDKALENYSALLRQSTYANLMDNHPRHHEQSVFQIDGNFGATAALAEMLVQSQRGVVRLLPALPTAWRAGRVEGLCVRGPAHLAMEWKDGHLVQATFTADTDTTLAVEYAGKRSIITVPAGKPYVFTP